MQVFPLCQRSAVLFGGAGVLPGEVHKLEIMAVAAFQRIIGF